MHETIIVSSLEEAEPLVAQAFEHGAEFVRIVGAETVGGAIGTRVGGSDAACKAALLAAA